MNWYLAKLVFNINIDNGNNASQFDEQTRLIQANHLEDAFFKARKIGKQEEEKFLNKENKPVDWKFIDVINLYPLDNVKDGEQIYSNTHLKEDATSFIQFIRQKSMLIQAKNLSFA
jgi:Fe-S cluster biosynthesis and repair protein YggX